jgi:hypothetical protein
MLTNTATEFELQLVGNHTLAYSTTTDSLFEKAVGISDYTALNGKHLHPKF